MPRGWFPSAAVPRIGCKMRPTGNRIEAVIGLVVIAVWGAVTAAETSSGLPWPDSYLRISQIVHGTRAAVILSVGVVWLFARTKTSRRA